MKKIYYQVVENVLPQVYLLYNSFNNKFILLNNIRNEKAMIMKNIYELGFALVETMLYLDTHPDDAAAIEYYAEIKDKYVQNMKKYSDYYGPLSMEYMVNDNYWMWVATPMPWEYKGGM